MQSCPPRWREGGTLSFLLIGENKLVVTPTEKDPPQKKPKPQNKNKTKKLRNGRETFMEKVNSTVSNFKQITGPLAQQP